MASCTGPGGPLVVSDIADIEMTTGDMSLLTSHENWVNYIIIVNNILILYQVSSYLDELMFLSSIKQWLNSNFSSWTFSVVSVADCLPGRVSSVSCEDVQNITKAE